MATSNFNRSFFCAAMGTLIEYYDYAVLGTFLPIISTLFFQADSPYDALMKGYYALLIAMIARPLGGVFFGSIGDLFGRKRALLLSMYGIALATIAIGLIPSYQVIGVWAGILLILAKSIQIFCFGGEYNGAGIFVVEHMQKQQEALASSILTSFTLMGGLLATLVGVIITADAMPDWSWRLAFLFGGIIGLIGIYSRKSLIESPQFVPAEPEKHGLVNLFKLYPRQLIAGIAVGGFSTIPFTTVLAFINPVLMTKGYLNSQGLMILQSFLITFAIVVLLASGYISDKKSSAWTMKYAALMLAILSYPMLKLVDSQSFTLIVLAEMGLIFANEALLAPANAFLKNLFPVQYRYRAASLSFTLGMSILGGLTPVIENHLYRINQQFSPISIWLIFIAVCTYFSIIWATQYTAHNKYGKAIDAATH